MKDRKVKIARFKTSRENYVLDISIRHDGGFYKVSASPIELDGIWEKYVGFSGSFFNWKDGARFSQKMMDSLAESVLGEERLWRMIEKIALRDQVIVDVPEEIFNKVTIPDATRFLRAV